jgi:hypothetical protein
MMQRFLSGQPQALSHRVSCVVGWSAWLERWVPSGSASAASRSEASLSAYYPDIQKMGLRTDEVKDGIAQDGSHVVDYGLWWWGRSTACRG